MNIFACDYDSRQSAIWLPDKLVVKMPLESAQILCTALWNSGEPAPYLPTHRKHPCVLWVARTRGNWNWLVEHGLALCDEFEYRYGKEHKSKNVILQVASQGPRTGELEPFAMAMPDKFKQTDPVLAYRAFLIAEKDHYATWKISSRRPKWWRAEGDEE
jgi:hypothetical protein